VSARRVALALVALASLSAAGCGQKRSAECNDLIKVINEGVQSLEGQGKFEGDTTGVAALKAMADVLDKIAGDSSRLTLATPELQAFSTEYQTMAREVSRAAREMAAAAETKDEKKMAAAQAAMEKAVKQEDPLVDSINKLCQAP
jgi:hypothetical protein